METPKYKTALIVGAGEGLSASLARLFAREEINVALAARKIEKLDYIAEGAGRTLGQAALQFILAEPSIVSVLPNIYDAPQLAELAAAPDTTPLSEQDLRTLADLYAHDFYLDPEDAPKPVLA